MTEYLDRPILEKEIVAGAKFVVVENHRTGDSSYVPGIIRLAVNPVRGSGDGRTVHYHFIEQDGKVADLMPDDACLVPLSVFLGEEVSESPWRTLYRPSKDG